MPPNSSSDPDSGLPPAPPAAPLAGTNEEKPGDRIGRYRLVEIIGEGGCGVVWMAEQEEPVRRQVALKVIKLGMDTKAVIARFEAERQALAMMDHPNIAKVLDGGATQTGRPYFVMELVRGIPITRFCDEHHLATKERLNLFIAVCRAIEHAHQKGIIHRDIKPSNVLVTQHEGAARPAVIDFGIAKATQGRLNDSMVMTAVEQLIGTPVYMSPEQAGYNGLDIDTRSDIYSLGVLLYELLTGHPPFDRRTLNEAGVDRVRQIIREREPPRPSTRFRTLTDEEREAIAKLRGAAPSQLAMHLRGDLDWIVLKALEKNRDRRYETANAFALDVQRHLANEPVIACPPTPAYRIGKFVRRHRGTVAATTAVVAALIIGIALSTFQAIRATEAEQEQVKLRDMAEKSSRAQARLRQRAVAGERDARTKAAALRRTAYVAEMNLAQEALADGNLYKARLLLDKYVPKSGEDDIRGFEWRYLWAKARGGEVATVAGYRGGFGAVAVSPDGSTLATVGLDYGIELRALPSRAMIKVIPGIKGRLLKFSPDGRWLFMGGFPEEVFLRRWDTKTWQEAPRLSGLQSPFVFTSDGKRMVACTGDQLAVYSLESWSTVATLPGKIQFDDMSAVPRQCLAISPDAKIAYFSGNPKVGIRRWDIDERVELEPLVARLNGYTPCLAMSPDGILASGDIDGAVILWDTQARRPLHRFENHRAWVTGLTFSQDGSALASASADQTLHLYDVALRKPVRRLIGHEGEVWSVAFTPDESQLFSASNFDKTVRLWDTVVPRGGPDFVRAFVPLAFVDANKNLFSWSPADGFVKFELATGRKIRTGDPRAPVPVEFDPFQFNVQLAPNLSTVAAAKGGKVEIFDLKTGERQRVLTHPGGGITKLAFSADGQFLATAGNASGIYLWKTSDWSSHRLALPPAAAETGFGIAFSPSGRYLAVKTGGANGLLFDLRTGGEGMLLRGLGNTRLVFSPDETKLAAGSTTNVIQLWDVRARKLTATLRGPMGGVFGLAFAPDGRTLASCSLDNFVRLWNLELMEETLKLPGIRGASGTTMFSPDGTALVANTSGDRIQVWRAPSWAEIAAAEKAQAVSEAKP